MSGVHTDGSNVGVVVDQVVVDANLIQTSVGVAFGAEEQRWELILWILRVLRFTPSEPVVYDVVRSPEVHEYVLVLLDLKRIDFQA